MTEDMFYKSAGMPTRFIIEALNREFGYDLDVDTVHQEKEEHYLTLVKSIIEIKAVVDVARYYHGKCPLGVASGGEHLVLDQTLDAVGVRDLFDAVIGADDIVNGKPEPDMFYLAAQKMGVAPEECVVYEDGVPGMIAAERAGMRVVDVRVLFPQLSTH